MREIHFRRCIFGSLRKQLITASFNECRKSWKIPITTAGHVFGIWSCHSKTVINYTADSASCFESTHILSFLHVRSSYEGFHFFLNICRRYLAVYAWASPRPNHSFSSFAKLSFQKYGLKNRGMWQRQHKSIFSFSDESSGLPARTQIMDIKPDVALKCAKDGWRILMQMCSPGVLASSLCF